MQKALGDGLRPLPLDVTSVVKRSFESCVSELSSTSSPREIIRKRPKTASKWMKIDGDGAFAEAAEEPALKEPVPLPKALGPPPPLPKMPLTGPSGRLEDQLPMEFFDEALEGDLEPEKLPPLPPTAGAQVKAKLSQRLLPRWRQGMEEAWRSMPSHGHLDGSSSKLKGK